MKNEFLVTKRVTAFLEAVSILEDTIKGHPGMMMLWGLSGRGKTSCIEKYATETDALYFYVQNGMTPAGLMGELVREMNGMNAARIIQAKRIITEELDERPRTLLIDEADKLSIDCIEHLRDIHDMTGNPIVFVGEPSLYGKLNARKRLMSRVTKTVEFGPVALEDVLVLGKRACDLKITPDAGNLLLKRCGGDFRPLYHDMRDIEQMAAANDVQVIEPDMVRQLGKRLTQPTPFKEA